MTTPEMHSMFRTLGQQMGMQLIRGILPESIDVYINAAIIEKTQTELLNSVYIAQQDSINTQSMTMGAINTFRSLYRTATYKLPDDPTNNESFENPDVHSIILDYNNNNGYYRLHIPTKDAKIGDNTISGLVKTINPMMYLGFSVEYDNNSKGNSVACRMIGADVLETTLRDYCNSADKSNPIACLSSFGELQGLDIYKDNEQLEIYTNTKGCVIKYLNIKYIKTPNVVKFDTDESKCIHCDLPDYTHYDIVQKAVEKFFISVGATSNNKQKE